MVDYRKKASPSPRKEEFSIEKKANQEDPDYFCSNLCVIAKPT